MLSDPQGESDADADIEDTDCRFDAHTDVNIFADFVLLVGLRRPSLVLLSSDRVTLLRQTPGARLSPANQLAEAQASSGGAAGHHRERRRRRAEPQNPPLEPQAQS